MCTILTNLFMLLPDGFRMKILRSSERNLFLGMARAFIALLFIRAMHHVAVQLSFGKKSGEFDKGVINDPNRDSMPPLIKKFV